MGKSKKNAKDTEKGRSTADYYKLNRKAIEDLAGADASNSPKVSKEELRKYRSASGKFHLADWFKALFIKFWFPAAACYFILWGLGMYMPSVLDQLFVMGIVVGMITDLLTNNALRFFEETEGANDRFMMFPKKGYLSFPLNILYSWWIHFLVFTIYSLINGILASITGAVDTVPLGVEPILFGLFYLACDTLCIEIKRLGIRIFTEAKSKAEHS